MNKMELRRKYGSIMYVSYHHYTLRYETNVFVYSIYVPERSVWSSRRLQEHDIVEFSATPITELERMEYNEGKYSFQYVASEVRLIRAANIIIGEGILQIEEAKDTIPYKARQSEKGTITYKVDNRSIEIECTRKVFDPPVEEFGTSALRQKTVRFASADYLNDKGITGYRAIIVTDTKHSVVARKKDPEKAAIRYTAVPEETKRKAEEKKEQGQSSTTKKPSEQRKWLSLDNNAAWPRKGEAKTTPIVPEGTNGKAEEKKTGTQKDGISTNHNMDDKNETDRNDHQKETSKTLSISGVNPTPMAVVQNGRTQEGVHEARTESIVPEETNRKEEEKKKLIVPQPIEYQFFPQHLVIDPLKLLEGNWEAMYYLKEKFTGRNK